MFKTRNREIWDSSRDIYETDIREINSKAEVIVFVLSRQNATETNMES